MASLLDDIYLFVARSFAPLAREMGTTDDRLLGYVAELGWSLPDVPPGLRALQSATDQVARSVGAVDRVRRRQYDGLASAGDAGLAIAQVAVDAVLLIDAVRSLSNSLASELPAPFVAATSIDQEFHRRLVEHSIVQRLERELLRPFLVMRALGLIEVTRQPADAASYQPPFTRQRIRWDRLQGLVRDPTAHAADVYGWGTPTLDGAALTTALRDLSFVMLHPGHFAPAPRALEQHVAGIGPTTPGQPGFVMPLLSRGPVNVRVGVHPAPKQTVDEPQGLLLSLIGAATSGVSFWLSSSLHAEVTTDFDLASGVGIVVRPDRPPEAVTGLLAGTIGAAPPGRAALTLTWRGAAVDGSGPILAVGPVELSGTGVRMRAEVTTVGAANDISIEIAVTDGRIVLRGAEGDGFLGRVLPAGGLAAALDLALGWSARRGLYFRGSATLDVSLPVHGTIGALTLDEVHARLFASETAIEAQAALSARVELGPVRVVIDRVGMALGVDLDGDGLGGAGLRASFLLPAGYGLDVAAGPIKGGGYLEHAATGYFGALALDVFGASVSAFGALDNHLPSGGYSLAAVVSAEFSPIQLGLGFTVDGVGGLIGIHRRVDTDALRTALRGPGIDDIFFAADPLAQAARLTGDLGRYFPAAEGRHVFGPAVKIGWGTPTVVTGTLAVLLEMPSPVRIVILGSVSATLPARDLPIIDLHVDVVGEIDFAQKRIAVDATLRDSTVAGFSILGDLAFRMSWGDRPSFVLSVGGFHSQFPKPPGFPELKRVLIPIGSGSDPRLDVTGFLALTSNTAQIGAQIELYASAGPLNVKGSVGFEALIQFSPFEFRAHLWAGVALRRGERVLAGVHFDGTLSGPTPYQVAGEACLSLWFVDLCVGFDRTFGGGTAVVLPQREIWTPLRAQIETPASWGETTPAGVVRAVMTAPPVGESATTRIDPGAALTLRQKVAPLDRRITRFAQGTPLGTSEFRVTALTMSGASTLFEPVTDFFAPAQFEALSEPDRLSRPGYELMVAGVTAGDLTTEGAALVKTLTYKTTLITGDERMAAAPYHPMIGDQLAAIDGSANATPPLRGSRGTFAPAPGTPPRFRLEEESYVIASSYDLTARPDLSAPATRGAAELALAAYLAAHPGLAGTLHVVPSFDAVVMT